MAYIQEAATADTAAGSEAKAAEVLAAAAEHDRTAIANSGPSGLPWLAPTTSLTVVLGASAR
ncbi:hypothetical protein [Streptomyces sp. NBC_01465]|uniref:hypothetical protein n=1 Tax=Streptomyces sp. NBC_01465 TaxID=2903878 RepID=UPI002E30E198|nr:hypothetical protein [Streptomyces sp. NBC_01465]